MLKTNRFLDSMLPCCDAPPGVPGDHVKICELSPPPSSSRALKNTRKGQLLLRPILSILEPSLCLSTASADILSHFPRSGSREENQSQLDSPSEETALQSALCFQGANKMCKPHPQMPESVLRWGESASWWKWAIRIHHQSGKSNTPQCLMEGYDSAPQTLSDSPPISRSLQLKADNRNICAL